VTVGLGFVVMHGLILDSRLFVRRWRGNSWRHTRRTRRKDIAEGEAPKKGMEEKNREFAEK
jgi:hypothetical protein